MNPLSSNKIFPDNYFVSVAASAGLLICCIGIIIVSFYARARMLDMPLERDEGEYAYAGQVILSGGHPYQDVYNMKFPGTYYFYALILLVFGQTVSAIHLGVLLIHVVITAFVFGIGKILSGNQTGWIAAACFALLSVGNEVQGIVANAEHFVLLFVVPAFFFLLKFLKEFKLRQLAISGLLFGLGILMKQHGAFIALSGVFILLFHPGSRIKATAMRFGLFILALIFPFLLWCSYSYLSGTFDQFTFLTFGYASEYVSYISPGDGINRMYESVLAISKHSWLFWVYGLAGGLLLFFRKTFRKQSLPMLAFVLFSLCSVIPGFYFRPHYWLLFMPGLAILSALFLSRIAETLQKHTPKSYINLLILAMLLVASVQYLWKSRDFFFVKNPTEVLFDLYGTAPFHYAKQIGTYIHQNTAPSEKIAIIGSEPEVLFYAKRKSVTGYIYTYAFLEDNPYAGRMIAQWKMEIEAGKPVFLIYSNDSGTWFGNADRRDAIWAWYREYVDAYYELAAVFEIYQRKVYQMESTGPEVSDPKGDNWMKVYKRVVGD